MIFSSSHQHKERNPRRRLHPTACACFLAAGLAVFGPVVSADEGVLEINIHCALSGGCFPGDSAGFPVTIANPGSYRLTSGLDLSLGSGATENITGIVVNADDVVIDLNGFTIAGSTFCTGVPPSMSCSPSGSGIGIEGATGGAVNTVVRNGNIRGMGANGVSLGDNARLADLRLRHNNGIGAALGAGAVVSRCIVTRNGGGIDAGARSRVRSVVAVDNTGDGMAVGQYSAVAHSVARNNTIGIDANTGARVRENSVAANNGSGFGVRITNSAGTVLNNTIQDNVGPGLDCDTSGGQTGYGGNAIGRNSSPTVQGNCTEVDTNVCESNTSCP